MPRRNEKRKKQEKKTNVLKVVYFDELSATDYIDICDGGRAEYSKSEMTKRMRSLSGRGGLSLSAKHSWLKRIEGGASLEGSGELSSLRQSLINKTVSNTVLTDYLEKSASDQRIREFRGFTLSMSKDSFAFIKVYTPYMAIVDQKDVGIDLSKLDEALENAKGYYELVASNGNERCVFRFNIKAFRNSYTISDLLKMSLMFQAIAVGKVQERLLKVAEELSPGHQAPERIPTAEEILDGSYDASDNELDVFDVMFAGVIEDG